MKQPGELFFKADGEWWYRMPSGTRQRASVKTCETCGTDFVTYPAGNARFCSQKCIRRQCRACDTLFAPTNNRNVYCSIECKRGTGVCENCGKTYTYSHHGAKRFCSTECFYEFTVPVGTVINHDQGYTITKVPPDTPGSKVNQSTRARWMLTHRYVMQQKLGRPLRKKEQVHHINGRRDDNRPENLELWKRSHPAGVRAADYHCTGCRCFEPKGLECH